MSYTGGQNEMAGAANVAKADPKGGKKEHIIEEQPLLEQIKEKLKIGGENGHGKNGNKPGPKQPQHVIDDPRGKLKMVKAEDKRNLKDAVNEAIWDAENDASWIPSEQYKDDKFMAQRRKDIKAKAVKEHVKNNLEGASMDKGEECLKFDKNGQWSLEKAAPKMGASVFNMDHIKDVAAMKDHAAAKAHAHSIVDASSANDKNRAQIKRMIDTSKSPSHLATGMSNHMLAHPGEGLKVIR